MLKPGKSFPAKIKWAWPKVNISSRYEYLRLLARPHLPWCYFLHVPECISLASGTCLDLSSYGCSATVSWREPLRSHPSDKTRWSRLTCIKYFSKRTEFCCFSIKDFLTLDSTEGLPNTVSRPRAACLSLRKWKHFGLSEAKLNTSVCSLKQVTELVFSRLAHAKLSIIPSAKSECNFIILELVLS